MMMRNKTMKNVGYVIDDLELFIIATSNIRLQYDISFEYGFIIGKLLPEDNKSLYFDNVRPVLNEEFEE